MSVRNKHERETNEWGADGHSIVAIGVEGIFKKRHCQDTKKGKGKI